MTLDPLRLGVEATRLGFRIAEDAIKLPFRIVGALLGSDEPAAPPAYPPDAPRAHPAPQAPSAPAAPTPAPPKPEPVAIEPDEPVAIEPEEPAHIDDEPELVGEFSEPGAEEGAGAEIHVDEPWDGYRRMKVADIQERVAVADAAQLAVVQLFESVNRKRKSVLDAVARRNRALANEQNAQNARTNGR